MSEFNKMIKGERYDCTTPVLEKMRVRAHQLCDDFNRTTEENYLARIKILH